VKPVTTFTKRLDAIAGDPQRSAALTSSFVAFVLVVFGLLIWSGQSNLLGPVYFLACLLIGAWFYATASPLYLGFVLWLWFVTAFVRRVIDYQIGQFTPPSRSLVLLTPFAVTLLTLLDVPRFGRRLIHRRYIPYLLCLVALAYGYLVGMVKVGFIASTMTLVRWLPPVLTGFYVLARWRKYSRHRQVLEGTLTWGILIIGVYGIIQYFFLPAWDAFWMRHAGMINVGLPYPYQVRIFSMLDSPGPFAVTLGTGLIMLFIGRGVSPILAAVPGYLSFLLAQVRGSWIGWMVAISTIIYLVKGRLRTRLVTIAATILVLTFPLAMQGPIAGQTVSRAQSLTNLEEDGSFRARMSMYRTTSARILTNPIGWGMGGGGFDSGIMTLFWNLGWPGGFLYLGGIALLVLNVLRESTFFGKIVGGVVAGYLIQFFAGSQLLGQVTGVLFWSLTGLAIASKLASRKEAERPNTTQRSISPPF
jgi:hypothetical protein